MAAVLNAGTERNWTGHPFVQASWYAFGRMAWDYTLSADTLAEEWLGLTFSNNKDFIARVKNIMLMSREAGVNYRSPLGLTHLYSQGDHYGPAPWTDDKERPDWNATYYHRADKMPLVLTALLQVQMLWRSIHHCWPSAIAILKPYPKIYCCGFTACVGTTLCNRAARFGRSWCISIMPV